MFWVTNTDSTATAGLFFSGAGFPAGPGPEIITHSLAEKNRSGETGPPSNEKTNASLVFSLLTQDGKLIIKFVLP